VAGQALKSVLVKLRDLPCNLWRMTSTALTEETPLTLRMLASHLRYARGSDQAKAAAKHFIRQPLTNSETGIIAEVSGGCLGKMLSKIAVDSSISQQAHHQAIANVDKLFALATRRRKRKATQERDIGRIAWLHHFDVPMPFDGEVLRVKMLVKEMTDKRLPNPLYTLSAVAIKKPPSLRREFSLEEADGPTPPGGYVQKFTAMIAEVKCGMQVGLVRL